MLLSGNYVFTDYLLVILLLVVGLILIIKGGDFFVDGASWLAETSGIPKFIIGATIVSVATTLPEIIVSLISAKESADLAIGNAVGSVTFNTGLIMSLALICAPFKFEKRKEYLFKGVLLTVTMAVLWLFCFNGTDLNNLSFASTGTLPLVGSIILLIFFITFIVENVISAKENAEKEENEEKVKPSKKEVIINLSKLIGGAAGIAIGAILLKDNSISLASMLGVPEKIIGVTIVAVGTSLPELVTMIIAVKKGQSSLSIGNIIGANTIDLAIILPLSSFVVGGAGLNVQGQFLLIDMPVTLAVIAIGVIPSLIFKKFSRWQGITMAAIYLSYFVLNIILVL